MSNEIQSVTVEENSIIRVNFAQNQAPAIDPEVEFPASKNFAETEEVDDLIGDLLGEFDDYIEEEEEIDEGEQWLLNRLDKLPMIDQTSQVEDIVDSINTKLQRLGDHTKRVKFYMDEIDLSTDE